MAHGMQRAIAMKLHPRTRPVQKARSALDEFLLNLEQEHQLTCPEILSLLGHAVAHFAKSALQMERHPHNPDKGADEA